jgi:hypothetical protein
LQLLGVGLAYAALAVGINGYEFGSRDHSIHLAFLDMAGDGGRWQGDLLARAASDHHSLFWTLQAPFAQAMGDVLWTALAYLLCLVATGAAVYHLSLLLWGRTWVAALSLALLAPAQFALGGVDTLDPLLLNRTAALPLELLAIALLYAGRPVGSFAALGLAVNLHAPSAVALAAALAIVHLVSARRGELRMDGSPADARSLLAVLACPLLALPVLVPWLAGHGSGGADLFVDGPWRAVLEARMSHHLFAGTWHAGEWLKMSLWLALAGLGLRVGERPRSLRFVVSLAGLLILWALAVGALLGDRLGVALALQLEAWQAFRFVTILCAMSAAAAWVDLLGRGTPTAVVLAGAMGVIGLGLTVHDRGPPRFQPAGEGGEIEQLGQWIEANLQAEDKLMVAPVGLEQLRWRTGMRSSTTWKDGGEALFARSFALNWKREMERNCACRPFEQPLPSGERPGVRLAELRRRLAAGHAAMTKAQLRKQMQLARAAYLVSGSQLQGGDTSLRSLYRGVTWSVYAPASAPAGAGSAAPPPGAGSATPPAGAAPSVR